MERVLQDVSAGVKEMSGLIRTLEVEIGSETQRAKRIQIERANWEHQEGLRRTALKEAQRARVQSHDVNPPIATNPAPKITGTVLPAPPVNASNLLAVSKQLGPHTPILMMACNRITIS